MAGRALPNLALTGFWGLGYDGFADENDLNLLKLSVLCQGAALSVEATAPTGGANGDVHMVQTGHVYVKDADVWVAIPAQTGWRLFDLTDGDFKTFTGGTWQLVADAGGLAEAPEDGEAYSRKDAAWVTLSAALDTISATEGSILYRNGTEWVALAPGTDGQVLSFDTGAPVWVDRGPSHAFISQVDYDALSPPDADTIYYIPE